MKRRLEQSSMQPYRMIEEAIVSATNNLLSSQELKNRSDSIRAHFLDNIGQILIPNLDLLPDLVSSPVFTIQQVIDCLKELGPARRMYKELSTLITLLLVIPTTPQLQLNAASVLLDDVRHF